ncbi:hypothetical protein RirG_236360 [Rhizophagus irregularis DAOM 197198w]|uniref:DUF659 domain-containing protein n=1 Tax=Rhizophagus irregularis (strain DAOM 197198w) TaxID=1432141 RepID=A0A015IJH2_RHIIW|nr:hypothetical protein RirG_236360 [Rhizophagus irregularis DAOM 197198w]
MANNFDAMDTFLEPLDLENELDDIEPKHFEPKKPGKKKNGVWNYFIEEESRKGGHLACVCIYCGDAWNRGRIPDMMAHLALQCENDLDEEIASGIQPKITSKLQKSSIDPGQRNLYNKALTRFFVCYGVPFSIVESPFFIDLVKNLCAGYQLPDRKTLSNTWLNNKAVRVTVNMEEILERQENLSLVITSERKEYVIKVKDYSKDSHTGLFTAQEIKKILTDIGSQRFSSVVSDGASAMQLAKRLISDEYPRIMPVRCIAHHIQLICTDIMKKIPLAKNQNFVTYFTESHQSGAILREEIKKELIVGGGLKSSVKTRWSTAWDCCSSVLRLETVFKNMLIDNSKAMNQSLRILVNNQNFWSNVEALANILEPAKNAVKSVECKNTTMADVFFALIQMAISIKALPTETSEELKEFRQKCIQFYNYRWKQFDFELYLLAYFLHPKYRGKGLIPETYQIIQRKALTLWQKIGGGSNSALALAIQMNDYDNYKSPYNFSYVDELQTSSSWWLGCKQSNHYLQELALYILSIVPHSASCECVFSILNWFTQKR